MILVPLIFMLFYFSKCALFEFISSLYGIPPEINGIKMEFVSIGLYIISLILASSWDFNVGIFLIYICLLTIVFWMIAITYHLQNIRAHDN